MKLLLFWLAFLNIGDVGARDGASFVSESPKLVITYSYGKFPSFPSHAQAAARKEQERVLGRAEVVKLKWSEYAEAKNLHSLIVEETHFGDKGQVIYRARSTFSGESEKLEEAGQKVAEEVIKGRKELELFSWWPIGSLP